MDDHDFTYEEDGHLYRNAGGIVRPSVTQILKDQGIFDFSRVPANVLENARRRGSNVHRWTAEYDRHGSIDETWIAEDERGYFDAWLSFRRESKCKIVVIEEPMLRTIAGVEVGGTPDRIIWIGASRYIVDLKCCQVAHPGWALQTANYELLETGRSRCGHMGRMTVQLFPAGRYKAACYDDPADAEAAKSAVILSTWDAQAWDLDAEIAALTLDNWKRNHKILAA